MFKLQVEDSRRRWFVLLDESQIIWLQGTLQTAAMRDWKLPSHCVKKSGSRSIHVGKFNSHRGEFLQISEQTNTGKVFKVIIPASGNNRGWAKAIHLLQVFYKAELRARIHHDQLATNIPSEGAIHDDHHQHSYVDAVKYGAFMEEENAPSEPTMKEVILTLAVKGSRREPTSLTKFTHFVRNQ
ncbi:unnamed protein product [Linum trigynum]|uniref:PH domain-containing protein n=1 Tax=Linum trigynum TaxID=586398 RepID=A0AAV2CF77_9ROSI